MWEVSIYVFIYGYWSVYSFDLWLVWYEKVPQSTSVPPPKSPSAPSLSWSPNYCIWVPVSPWENRWTLTQSLIQRGPGLVRPAARSSAECAFRVHPNTPRQLLGKEDTATTFECQSIWRLYRWQEDSGRSGTAAESRSGVGVSRAVYAGRGWPSARFHGRAEQLSPMMVCFPFWALLRCSLCTSTAHFSRGISVRGTRWERSPEQLCGSLSVSLTPARPCV